MVYLGVEISEYMQIQILLSQLQRENFKENCFHVFTRERQTDRQTDRFRLSMCKLEHVLTYLMPITLSGGHQRPLAITLCSGLLWSFRTSWSLAVSALLQCLTSNCCEADFLSLPLQVPGQGLACGAGCWLLEGMSDPVSCCHKKLMV